MALNVNIKSLESFSVIIKIIVQRMKCLFVQIEASLTSHIITNLGHHIPSAEWGSYFLFLTSSGQQLVSAVASLPQFHSHGHGGGTPFFLPVLAARAAQ